MADDLLSRIDALTSCGWCGAELDERSASGDFCTEDHQAFWSISRAQLHDPAVKLKLAVVALGEGFRRSVETMRHGFAGLTEHARQFQEMRNHRGRSDEATLCMEHALEARQNRNTGPAVPNPGQRQGRRR